MKEKNILRQKRFRLAISISSETGATRGTGLTSIGSPVLFFCFLTYLTATAYQSIIKQFESPADTNLFFFLQIVPELHKFGKRWFYCAWVAPN
jgi:hypothetical protein